LIADSSSTNLKNWSILSNSSHSIRLSSQNRCSFVQNCAKGVSWAWYSFIKSSNSRRRGVYTFLFISCTISLYSLQYVISFFCEDTERRYAFRLLRYNPSFSIPQTLNAPGSSIIHVYSTPSICPFFRKYSLTCFFAVLSGNRENIVVLYLLAAPSTPIKLKLYSSFKYLTIFDRYFWPETLVWLSWIWITILSEDWSACRSRMVAIVEGTSKESADIILSPEAWRILVNKRAWMTIKLISFRIERLRRK